MAEEKSIIEKILIKRGPKENLPELDEGELAFCTDSKELVIGTDEGNYYTELKKLEN